MFAKSDLIHRQQEGYSKAAMSSGLCRGMARTLIGTILRAKPLHKPIAIIGKVPLNEEVLRWLSTTQALTGRPVTTLPAGLALNGGGCEERRRIPVGSGRRTLVLLLICKLCFTGGSLD